MQPAGLCGLTRGHVGARIAANAITRLGWPSRSRSWLSGHADPGAPTIAFVERAVRCLRGSSKRRRILSSSEVGAAESGASLRLSATRSEIAGAGSRRRGWIYVIAQEPLTPALSPATRRRCLGTGGAAAGWAALLSFVQTRGNRGTRPLLLRLRLRASRCGELAHCCGSSLAGVSAR